MFLSLLKKRRSIRQFQGRPVGQEMIDQLCQAVLLSPSSRGLNPWEFIVITDRELLAALAGAKQGAGFLAKAPLAIAIVTDPQKSDVWIEDASIASSILLFTAQDLGLGACWVQIRKRNYRDNISAEEYVTGLLQIPGTYRVASIIGIGYPAEQKPAYPDTYPDRKKIYFNRYGNFSFL